MPKNYFQCIIPIFLFFFNRVLFSSLISVFFFDHGYTAANISRISIIALVFSFAIIPSIGRYADLHGIKRTSTFLLIIASLSSIIFSISQDIMISTITYCLITICINALHPLVEKQSTSTNYQYKVVRIWGTIGNALGIRTAGIIYQYISPGSVYLLFAIICICLICAIRKDDNPNDKYTIETKSRDSFKYPKSFFIHLVIVFCFYAALDSKSLFLSAFLSNIFQSINASSIILFLSALMEIFVITFSDKINQINSKKLIIYCLLMLGFQLLIYSYSANYYLIGITTLLLNSSVAMLFIIANIKTINNIIDNKHQFSSLSIVSSVRYLSAVIGQTFSGFMIDAYSYKACFSVLFLVIQIAIVIMCTNNAIVNDKSNFT